MNIDNVRLTPDLKLDLHAAINIAGVKELMEAFFAATQIPVGIVDSDDRWIVSLGRQDICTKFHCARPESEKKCVESDCHNKMHLKDRVYLPSRCVHGMMDVTFPIIVDNTHVGTLFIGQFFNASYDDVFFRKQAVEHGHDPAAYLETLKKVAVIPRERIDQLTQFFTHLVALIADAGNESIKRRQAEKDMLELKLQWDTRLIERSAWAKVSRKSEALLRHGGDGIHLLDADGNVVLANDAFCHMLGYTQDEIQGMNVAQWDVQWSAAELKEKISVLMKNGSLFETRHRHRNGTVFDVEIQAVSAVIDGKPRLYASSRDISKRKKSAERVHRLANFDLLTDLPNRALLNDRLQQALSKAWRDHTQAALMFIDLDKFKLVNDALGHHAGDLLLKEAAIRMQHCVRESDTVARVGGDEFVVLLPTVEVRHDALMVAEKILMTLKQPFNLTGRQIHISASIGIAIYPEHGNDEGSLFNNADHAMYRAKQAGGAVMLWQTLSQRPIAV